MVECLITASSADGGGLWAHRMACIPPLSDSPAVHIEWIYCKSCPTVVGVFRPPLSSASRLEVESADCSPEWSRSDREPSGPLAGGLARLAVLKNGSSLLCQR